ncbi:YrhA family protein [Oceanobacillus sp. J11TS1]|uniref:YrhA family protein n=1 Tax=Oceanobacillus sp. J11TS1 TaxID=2807191 RepID=UPI001B0B9604|nr:YrhA family protein [Oceanobacillus sp. J11TS1]GIO23683.1 hypothetical protein J11TS1_22640 [Oceanobacillus sp. J11TS1]
MWQSKLNEIKREKKLYEEEINIGAVEKEISDFEKKVLEEFKCKLPEDYKDVLRIINGIEFNGFILYGIDEEILKDKPNQQINGFLELNHIWHENVEQKKYLFLGESNISWYVYDLKSRKFLELDNPSGEKIGVFKNFNELFTNLLEDALS